MFQTKRFGLVASKQEYLMLCRAERTMKEKRTKGGKHNAMVSNHTNSTVRSR